jgi:hypothetical protein
VAQTQKSRSLKPVDRQRIAEVMSYPGIYECADILEAVCRKNHNVGLRRQFPPDYLFGLWICQRVTRSAEGLARGLAHDDDLNRACRNAYTAITGRKVPRNAPSADQINDPARRLSKDEDALKEFLRRQVVIGVAHAQAHGNLLPGDDPDWAHPDPRQQILGDGVIFRPHTEVALVRDPESSEWIPYGSLAKDPTRVRRQTRTRSVGADGKSSAGVTFICLTTETDHGPVVLAVDRTFGAEAPVLIPMVEQVVSAAGGGVATLAYDRVVCPGRLQDDLMARLRVSVVNKPVARALKRNEFSARAALGLQVVAERAAKPGARQLNQRQLEIAVNRRAKALRSAGRLPAGLSIYPTTRGFDVIDSQHRRFVQTHPGAPDGHEDVFIVDDETLYLADPDDTRLKGVYCPPTSSVPELTPQGSWARRTYWQVPCEQGDWTLERLWTPGLPKEAQDANQRHEQKVVALMDPVPRCAKSFALANRRSTTESDNNFLKSTVAHYGRAAHLDVNMQTLAFFAATQVLTAITWQRHPDARRPWRRTMSHSAAA